MRRILRSPACPPRMRRFRTSRNAVFMGDSTGLRRKVTARGPSAAVGRNRIGGSPRPPYLQSFNTEVTAMLRALRVEGLIVTEYTEPPPGNDMLIRT